jgi:hypothetical protein
VGPYMIGLLAGGSGGYGAAMLALASMLTVSGGLILGEGECICRLPVLGSPRQGRASFLAGIGSAVDW